MSKSSQPRSGKHSNTFTAAVWGSLDLVKKTCPFCCWMWTPEDPHLVSITRGNDLERPPYGGPFPRDPDTDDWESPPDNFPCQVCEGWTVPECKVLPKNRSILLPFERHSSWCLFGDWCRLWLWNWSPALKGKLNHPEFLNVDGRESFLSPPCPLHQEGVQDCTPAWQACIHCENLP